MRYPSAEKLEIIRRVEQSHLPVRRTLDKRGIPRATFYRWYIFIDLAGGRRWKITAHVQAGCGTASPPR
jgi:hypothetical protein